MSDVKSIRLRDANTLEPKPDATPIIIAYRGTAGDLRTPPAVGVVNLGDGLFSVTGSTDDVNAGTAFLVDCGDGVHPRYWADSFASARYPFHAMVFQANDGTLWSGAAPDVTEWKTLLGVDIIPAASLVPLIAPYFYGLAPKDQELFGGVCYAVDGAEGCPNSYDGSFLFEAPAAPSGLSLGQAVKAELIASPDVFSLIGTRIFPNVRPQAAAFPLAVYSVVSQVPENALNGSAQTRLKHTRLQVDSYGKTYESAHEVAIAIENVLANLSSPDFAGWKDNERDLYENETQLHRVSSDYLLSRG